MNYKIFLSLLFLWSSMKTVKFKCPILGGSKIIKEKEYNLIGHPSDEYIFSSLRNDTLISISKGKIINIFNLNGEGAKTIIVSEGIRTVTYRSNMSLIIDSSDYVMLGDKLGVVKDTSGVFVTIWENGEQIKDATFECCSALQRPRR